MIKQKILLFLYLFVFSLSAEAQLTGIVFNVKNYGALGDGKTFDSPSINKAIEAAVSVGGGMVYFPAGTYLSYSVHLKSNISLYLDQGAILLAAEPTDKGGYDEPEPNEWGDKFRYQDFGHSHWHNSLIWGENLENVSILGPGIINGKGLTREGDPRYRKQLPGTGNKAISLKLCRNVIIRDITLLFGGHFAILATGVDNFTLDNLKIDTNRDGIDVDCCNNVRISNCTVNSPWDDAICLKSSYALGYARTTENVTITNCQVSGFDRGTLFNGTYKREEAKLVPDKGGPTGRIKFGTESNGGFKNITISNCNFVFCRGLALESVDGALLEDISISNITMRDIINAPIFLRLGARMRGPENIPIGKIQRVNISNIVVYNADPRFGSIITGIPGNPFEDIRMSNITIFYKGGGTKEQAEIIVPENEKKYPDPDMFGEIPSYGFFIRHVKNLEMSNLKIKYLKEDYRPAFILDDVYGIDFMHLNVQHEADIPLFVLKNVNKFNLHFCKSLPDVFIENVTFKKL